MILFDLFFYFFFEFFFFLALYAALWKNDVQHYCDQCCQNYRGFTKNRVTQSGKLASAADA